MCPGAKGAPGPTGPAGALLCTELEPELDPDDAESTPVGAAAAVGDALELDVDGW
jgi:hypothetical protein